MVYFNFGENWLQYSKNALSNDKLQEVINALKDLVGLNNIKGKLFLDIGCGSGVHSIAAIKIGAQKVIGFDLSEESVKSAEQNVKMFGIRDKINFYRCSILDKKFKKFGNFDIVYSWGVLHHTGNMWKSIENAMQLVSNNGLFAVAIYNKHWSSSIWRIIKYIYNISPKIIKKLMIFNFYWIIFVLKFFITFKNPLRKKRGMNFYYDIIDWVGGYPYEYASKEEIIDFFQENNFELIKFIKPETAIGCNEFVFKKGK